MIVSSSVRPYAKLAPLPLQNVSLRDGFWSRRQAINHRVSLRHGYRQLERAGNFENLKLAAGQTTGAFRGPVFMDEDVYKWLEALAYEIGNTHDPELERLADQTIELLAAAQQGDGYLNSYYQVVKPGERWTDLDFGHEMYCAGHLIQAAVAHHRATGKTSLLDLARRFADHIAATFGPGRRAGTDGHPEIETALVELYRESGEPRYLDLAEFLIDQRGQRKMRGLDWSGPEYHQDHVPVRDASEVMGHAVRQLYLMAGVADLYLETGETALLQAAQRQWEDMTAHKLHLTGGLGARYEGESFGEAYELPSDRSYLETCTTVANMMWNWRMLLATGEARFADLLERSLYNGFLSGVALTGDRFFYTNPLQSRHGAERQAWYRVACCPPNVMRQIAAVGDYIATVNARGVQVHQYISSEVTAQFDSGRHVALALETDYPWEGRVKITVKETDGAPWELALRVPGWCDRATVQVKGAPVAQSLVPASYLQLERAWQRGDTVQLDLLMVPQLIAPNPRVDAIRDSLAIQRGPIVYCLEEMDQPPGTNLLDVRLDPSAPLHDTWREDLGVVAIQAQGALLDARAWGDRLYRPADGEQLALRPLTLTAIPYFAWANRRAGAMRVWIPRV